MLGVGYQGDHSSLFSISQMMLVVTEKQNGATNILEKVTEPANYLICTVYNGPFNCAPNPNDAIAFFSLGAVKAVKTNITLKCCF